MKKPESHVKVGQEKATREEGRGEETGAPEAKNIVGTVRQGKDIELEHSKQGKDMGMEHSKPEGGEHGSAAL
ncbi:hypothetical protein AMTR_s00040p00220800 [Amborella trichopoda]|uniref:Uncharacterized protein n=1 Tax=Amborella trichopoda TaxID=13333 RepID=W1PT78_AMBTC|nr:hypothetical protein AMTR_s00040p00220800 [Amborella trichopoda]